jgi:spore coat protein U-like protein
MFQPMPLGWTRIAALLALPFGALASTSASAATANATVTVNIVKSLTLTATGSLNFGTIVAGPLTSSQTVSLSPANIITCGSGSVLACSGATSVPTYNVQGTNKATVSIFKTATQLTNSSDGSRLTLTPLGPSSVLLTNSGAPGVNFTIGGSITIAPTTSAGVYTGVVNVTVDYQ